MLLARWPQALRLGKARARATATVTVLMVITQYSLRSESMTREQLTRLHHYLGAGNDQRLLVSRARHFSGGWGGAQRPFVLVCGRIQQPAQAEAEGIWLAVTGSARGGRCVRRLGLITGAVFGQQAWAGIQGRATAAGRLMRGSISRCCWEPRHEPVAPM